MVTMSAQAALAQMNRRASASSWCFLGHAEYSQRRPHEVAQMSIDWSAATAQFALGACTAAKSTSHHLRMVRRARQVHAQQDCYAKIQQLQRDNAALKATVGSWEQWFQGLPMDGVTKQVVRRLSAISPVIYEQSLAAAECRAPLLSSSTRLRRNVASHVFTENLDFDSEVNLRQAQHGPHRRFDVWPLQSGMCSGPECVAGAVVETSSPFVIVAPYRRVVAELHAHQAVLNGDSSQAGCEGLPEYLLPRARRCSSAGRR